jgi:hypothetical protein
MGDGDILMILGARLEPSRAARGKTGGMMPQTRPRGLTGSVTTGGIADPHTRFLCGILSHPLTLTLTLTHAYAQPEPRPVG